MDVPIDLAVYRLRDGGPVAAAAIALSAGCEFLGRVREKVPSWHCSAAAQVNTNLLDQNALSDTI